MQFEKPNADGAGPAVPAPPVRMEPLAVLPVFFKLAGKRAVVVGGSLPAVWKAELLSASGATVDIYDAAPCRELVALAASPPGGPITLIRRAWTRADFAGAALAIGAVEDEGEAERVAAAARQAGVPVNIIDKPGFCDFQFGTIVSRSPLVIGISTDGAAPVFGQAIRARIEALLPQSLRRWAQAAKDWRPDVQALKLDFQARRRFWEVFAGRALDSPDVAPTERDREACRVEAAGEHGRPALGRVTLVGAGSGDPDDVTLKGMRALQGADQVFYGPGVSPAVAGFARREALKVAFAGKPGKPEAYAGLRAALERGQRVVWIDSGDPSTCVRWKGRRATLSTLGFDPVITSGIGTCDECGSGCPAWIGPLP